ncbi:hypothetical protein DFA_02112 [Cavenderia fasciculata]|uniref:Tetrapyrrole biosynthesis uroporphyrinogen III synthase domain-containing protein n=1 Tax=Cavenderia fasciculata TaxID=261658 RepID=F4PYQ9_CACFS|nr:uncharacterized protein DFA_02112 [Cavenderia fasciculata]EGG19325.1 hypothetical protein DFA_02112 [Cavenderia fasciculata]|eukprot:XP_004357596.1 hypothetical protein DFA_02112 [Cavenderia fasciculata]
MMYGRRAKQFYDASRFFLFPGVMLAAFLQVSISYSQGTMIANDPVKLAKLVFGCLAISTLGHSLYYFINSYVDFISGVDDPKTSHDRTLFDSVNVNTLFKFMMVDVVGLTVIASYLVMQCTGEYEWLKPLFVLYPIGVVAISISYTHLKYIALGNVNYCVYVIMTTAVYYTILTNALPDKTFWIFNALTFVYSQLPILGNYHRDLEEDAKAGIKTVPILLGRYNSWIMLSCLIITGYMIVLHQSFYYQCYVLLASFMTIFEFKRVMLKTYKGDHTALNYYLGRAGSFTYTFHLISSSSSSSSITTGTDTIVLFKSQKDDQQDPYLMLFKEKRFNVEFIPLLTIKLNCNDQQVLTTLKNISTSTGDEKNYYYSSLVITSSNAMQSLINIVEKNDDHNLLLLDILRLFRNGIFLVGESSLNLLIKYLQQQQQLNTNNNNNNNDDGTSINELKEMIIVESNANLLSNRIIEKQHKSIDNNNNNNRVLYLCGNIRRDELPSTLKSNNIILDELIIYENTTNNNSTTSSGGQDEEEDMVLTRLNMIKDRIQWIVFFSPSGVDYIINNHKSLIHSESNTGCANIRIASIGPTTTKHLKEQYEITPNITSSSPNAQSLLNSILEYNNNQK